MKRGTMLKMMFLAGPVLIGSSFATGQSTATVTYPQDNVGSGAIAARRPGLRVSAAITAHTERMDVLAAPQASATPQESTKTDRHTLVLTTFLQSLLDTLQQLANALLLAAQVNNTTST